MDNQKAKDILMRFEKLKDERKNFEDLWQAAEWNVAPILQKWENEKPKDGYIIPQRITNQPTQFAETCKTGILGYGMSENINWFKLSLTDNEKNEMDGVAQWLEKCERILRRTLSVCGAYPQAQRWVNEAIIYGHSAMLIEELHNSDKPIRYYTPSAQEFYLDQNEIGETDTCFRAYWSDIENLVNYYGKKAMHEKVLRRYENYQENKHQYTYAQDMTLKILHATFVRRTGKPEFGETVTNKKWASFIIDVENQHIIKESGYDDFPYAVFFWEKIGKPYGVSPSIMALNDIAMFQTASEAYIKIQQKLAEPSFILPEILKGKENLRPGGITYLENPNIQIPTQLPTAGSLPDTLEAVRFYEKAVKDWFHVDFFIMLRQNGLTADITATAINAMQGEQTALLSAIVSNFFEGQQKMIQRTFDILAKKHLLPEMPFALQVAGGSLKVDFVGVLAQAQRAAYEDKGLQSVMAIAAQFAQFGKTDPRFLKVLDWIKPDTLFKNNLIALGVPKEVMRTQQEYDELQAGLDEQAKAKAAEEAAAQNSQALLQNAKNLNQPMQEGSMLEGLLNAKSTPPKQGAF